MGRVHFFDFPFHLSWKYMMLDAGCWRQDCPRGLYYTSSRKIWVNYALWITIVLHEQWLALSLKCRGALPVSQGLLLTNQLSQLCKVGASRFPLPSPWSRIKIRQSVCFTGDGHAAIVGFMKSTIHEQEEASWTDWATQQSRTGINIESSLYRKVERVC